MPRIAFPGFIGAAYQARSPMHGTERLVNLYAEHNPSTAQWALYSTPGLARFATFNDGPVRGLYRATTGRVFAVAGPGFYEVFANGLHTLYGLCPGQGPVPMADNGLAVLLVNGQDGFVFDLTTSSYQAVTDPDFPPASAVAYLDGYFVVNVVGTGRFMITALFDPLNVSALDMATAEASADPLVTLLVDHRELWLFGTQTIEVWFNAGTSPFPLERIQGAVIEQGTCAPESVRALDNTVYWLQGNANGQGALMRARGYQPEAVSPPGLEAQWSQYGTRADAEAFTYRQDGHTSYVLNFPTGDTTWVLDTAAGLWHQRAYLLADGSLARHRARCHTFAFGQHLVGDYEHGRLYTLAPTVSTDDGREIVRIRTAPHLRSSGVRLTYQALEVQLEAGVGVDGLAPLADLSPALMLRWADDGGHSFRSERWTTVGAIGRRAQRARWRRLGQSRDRTFELRLTAGVPLVLTGAWLDAQEDAS